MRTLLKTAFVLGLLAPALAFAAYNDVTLTADTVVVSAGGVSVNVTGTSASLDTITVDANNFTATLQSGSTMTISAPNLSITTEPALGLTTTCSGGVLTATIPASGGATVTVAPSSIACNTTAAVSSSAGGGPVGLIGTTNNSGGGGGTSSLVVEAPAAVVPSASGLSLTQIDAILSLLSSFGADQATMNNVKSALNGEATSGAGAPVSAFVRNLEFGMSGEDVKALQVYLNTHGYIVASSGPGSPGNETTKFGGATRSALIKFQEAMDITPAAGYFGPKTRAAAK